MKRSWIWIVLATTLAALPAAAQTGGLRYTITVTEFENKAGWYHSWDIGDAWGTVMTDILNQTGKFIVLGEADMRNEAIFRIRSEDLNDLIQKALSHLRTDTYQ